MNRQVSQEIPGGIVGGPPGFIPARKFILAERLQRVWPLGVDNITASIFVDKFVEFLRVFDQRPLTEDLLKIMYGTGSLSDKASLIYSLQQEVSLLGKCGKTRKGRGRALYLIWRDNKSKQ